MTIQLQTAVITAKYVNPPKEGKKRGSIKTQDDTIYGVFPSMLNQFQPGQTYEITYEQQGEWRTIKAAKPVAVASASAPASSYYKPKPPSECRRIFVQGLIQAGIASGKVELKSAAALNELIRVLCAVYDSSPLAEGEEPREQRH